MERLIPRKNFGRGRKGRAHFTEAGNCGFMNFSDFFCVLKEIDHHPRVKK